MKPRFIFGTALFATMLSLPPRTQSLTLTSSSLATNPSVSTPDLCANKDPRKSSSLKEDAKREISFRRNRFFFLSAAVYGMAFADMHQTLVARKDPWWYEGDPFAKPLVRLPAPAYYATGFALATGANFLSWKMGHSRKWHKLAVIPQLLTITGNALGAKSNS